MMLVVLAFLSVFLSNTEAGSHSILQTKPEFLNPCVLGEAGFNECLANNLRPVFVQWKDRIPGTSVNDPIDPLHVKSVKINQPGDVISLDSVMTNIVVKGASRTVIKNVEFTELGDDTYEAKVTAYIPELLFEFDYVTNGKVLAIMLDGQGKGRFKAKEVVLLVGLRFQAVKNADGITLAQLKGVDASIENIGDFYIRLENIFMGNKELEDAVHVLFKENWRQFFGILRNPIEQVISAFLKDRLKRTFRHVPATFFIKNLK